MTQKPNNDSVLYTRFARLDSSGYAPFLNRKLQGVNEGGISQNLGPVLLRFKNNAEPPLTFGNTNSIYIRTIPMPNLADFGEVKLEVQHVWNNKKDIFDPDGFENSGSSGLKYHASSVPSVIGSKSFAIKEGYTADNIDKIEGILTIRLPLNLETITVPVQNFAQEYRFENGSVAFTKNETTLTCKVKKTANTNIEFLFYDSENNEIRPSNHSWWGSDDSVEHEYSNFNGEVEKVELVAYSGFFTKEFPFTLTPHDSTPEVVIKTPLNDDQKQIIRALNEFSDILEKEDVIAFFNYVNQSTEEVSTEQPSEAEQKEIKEAMDFVKIFFNDINPEELEANTTEWDIEGNNAKITINKYNSFGYKYGSVTSRFSRINGKWFVNL